MFNRQFWKDAGNIFFGSDSPNPPEYEPTTDNDERLLTSAQAFIRQVKAIDAHPESQRIYELANRAGKPYLRLARLKLFAALEEAVASAAGASRNVSKNEIMSPFDHLMIEVAKQAVKLNNGLIDPRSALLHVPAQLAAEMGQPYRGPVLHSHFAELMPLANFYNEGGRLMRLYAKLAPSAQP